MADYTLIESEEHEVEQLIPAELTSLSPRFSTSIADGTCLQEAMVINDDSSVAVDGERDRGEFDVCSICFQAWTSDGLHRICCLPCGHIYGISCIKEWIQQCQGSGKCPQCNSLCTLKDIRLLYANRLGVSSGETLHKFPFTEEGFIGLKQFVISLMDKIDALKQESDELNNAICIYISELVRRVNEVSPTEGTTTSLNSNVPQ